VDIAFRPAPIRAKEKPTRLKRRARDLYRRCERGTKPRARVVPRSARARSLLGDYPSPSACAAFLPGDCTRDGIVWPAENCVSYSARRGPAKFCPSAHVSRPRAGSPAQIWWLSLTLPLCHRLRYSAASVAAKNPVNQNEAPEKPQRCAHRSAEGEKISNRTIALLVFAVVAATALTVEVTYFILDRFVLHNPNDPLTKARGLSPAQKQDERGINRAAICGRPGPPLGGPPRTS
jgi:hypothetical protein